MLKKTLLMAAGVVLFAPLAMADGLITPTGEIELVCTVTGDQTIEVDFGSATQTTIGDMTVTCNNAAGFTVNAGSVNSSKLCTAGCGANKERGYKGTWLGQAVAVALGSTGTPTVGGTNPFALTPVDVDFVMTLDSTGTDDLVAGTYTDPITITVAAL